MPFSTVVQRRCGEARAAQPDTTGTRVDFIEAFSDIKKESIAGHVFVWKGLDDDMMNRMSHATSDENHVPEFSRMKVGDGTRIRPDDIYPKRS